jgi:hypothetical protein
MPTPALFTFQFFRFAGNRADGRATARTNRQGTRVQVPEVDARTIRRSFARLMRGGWR